MDNALTSLHIMGLPRPAGRPIMMTRKPFRAKGQGRYAATVEKRFCSGLVAGNSSIRSTGYAKPLRRYSVFRFPYMCVRMCVCVRAHMCGCMVFMCSGVAGYIYLYEILKKDKEKAATNPLQNGVLPATKRIGTVAASDKLLKFLNMGGF